MSTVPTRFPYVQIERDDHEFDGPVSGIHALPDNPQAEIDAARAALHAAQDAMQLADIAAEEAEARTVVHICSACKKRMANQQEHYQHLRKAHPRGSAVNHLDESQGLAVRHVRRDIAKYA